MSLFISLLCVPFFIKKEKKKKTNGKKQKSMTWSFDNPLRQFNTCVLKFILIITRHMHLHVNMCMLYKTYRFWRDILQRHDGGSNFASIKAFSEEFSHTTIFFLLVGNQHNDGSNRKSTFRIIFVSIFGEIVILLGTTYIHLNGYYAILGFQQ